MNHPINALYSHIRSQLLSLSMSPEQAEAESWWILEFLFQYRQTDLYTQPERSISDSELAQLNDLLYQRVQKRIPLQYLLHEAWFFGLKFYVNPSVLIPRPETELLVEKARAFLKPGMRVLDVGTGPGTIAIAISHQLSRAVEVMAVDLSPEALQVARMNQKMLGTTVSFLPSSDLFEALSEQRFDLIVSNPPYIDVQLKPTLTPEVLVHEPAMALFPPNDDAFYFYRRLASEGKAFLKPGGRLLVECGVGMTPDIAQIFLAQGFQDIEVIRDYAGLDRIVCAAVPNT